MKLPLRWIGCLALAAAAAIAEEKPQPATGTPVPAGERRAANADVEKVFEEFQGRGDLGDDRPPLTPEQTLQSCELAEGLTMDLVAAEPDVMQPLSMTFDARGRLWVVQYLQYPFPAGLKIVHYDQHLRAIFDNVPRPPPHHVHGLDKISVLEDQDGDGRYEAVKDVITGLNIATSVAVGHGGLWVLNPPYLLFYPDANGDDVPDADPQVHLSGFGLEDTHAVANSLAWGPDGWLYGATGSTTTSRISSSGSPTVSFEGQSIWRYHPDAGWFEVFAEGGGNTFSLEFDDTGNAFSGTNAGSTRGMSYPQGSYGEKNFGKHGPLTNPYAFGYFHHLPHQGDQDRFAQTFVIYGGGTLPERYHGQIIAANALHHRVWASDLIRDGSSYRTVDLPVLCKSNDSWFRPVDVKVGPDGAVYLADWYDTRLSHVDPRDTWHKTSGRIYRLQNSQTVPRYPTDLNRMSAAELLSLLDHPNRWQRMTAVRLLAERQRSAPDVPEQKEALQALQTLAQADRPDALPAVWALAQSGHLPEESLAALLQHPRGEVRRWSVRLLGDRRTVSASTAQALATLAASETDVDVRSQLAASAQRFSASTALPILQALITHDDDLSDPHLPLQIWWGLEVHCNEKPVQASAHLGVPLEEPPGPSPREQVLTLFSDADLWKRPLVREVLASRLTRRFASAGLQADDPAEKSSALAACERLLQQSPPEARGLLMAGFLEACQGQQIPPLPKGLQQAIDEYQRSLGELDLVLGLRLGKPEALAQALALIRDEKGDLAVRLQLLGTLSELDVPEAKGPLLALLRSPSSGVRAAALLALARFSNVEIGQQICNACQSTLTEEFGMRDIAFRVLASRAPWTSQLVQEVEQHRLLATGIPADVLQQMRLHSDEQLQQRIEKIWGRAAPTDDLKKAEIQRLRTLLTHPDPAGRSATERLQQGQVLFQKHCGNCHTLFAQGGQIGPNLTGYERTNLDFLLLSIVAPSAGIREEFVQYQLVTEDGRILTGMIVEQTPQSITLRDANNHSTILPREQIEELQAMKTSLMPEGLMQKLSPTETTALFQYLMNPTPPDTAAASN